MELIIFDRNINYKGLFEKQSSFIRTRRYSKCGEFELTTSFDANALDLLSTGSIVYKKGDLEAGYITHRSIELDPQGKEVLTVKGRFLTCYLNKRIIWGTQNINSTAEMAIRDLVNKQAINPVNTDRKIPLLELGTLKNYTETIQRQSSYKNLLEEIEDISIENELGIRTLFDIQNKKLIFDVYKGIVRTNPITFSREFENILKQEYTDSVDNYRNVALIAGEGEGIARVKTTIGDATGLDREETFVDAKDLKKTETVDDVEVTLTPTQYIEVLKNRGNTKLSEMVKIQTFDSKVNTKSNLVYKQDFDLGDIVTVNNRRWNVTISTRITEIQEVYEEDGFKIYVTFGDNIPTILDKIKQAVIK